MTGVQTCALPISVGLTYFILEMTVELIAPIAIENGTKFSIREGGRTVGAGNVTEIIK